MLVSAIDTGLDASLTAAGRERPREGTSAAAAPETAASRSDQRGVYKLSTILDTNLTVFSFNLS